MKNYRFAIIPLGFLLFVTGCSPGTNRGSGRDSSIEPPAAIQTNAMSVWNPKTEPLNDSVRHDTHSLGLDRDVKNFYELLHQKDWKAAYEMRLKTYKKDYPEATYLNDAEKEESNWMLLDYQVLSVQKYGEKDATIIFKFVELPGPRTSYSAVDWHKENDGVWRCDDTGLHGLGILIGTRPHINTDDDGN